MSVPPERPEPPPQYTKYRARPRLFDRGGDVLARFRGRLPGERVPHEREPRPRKRITLGRVLKWLGVGVAAWLALSLLLFLISAQIQRSNVEDDARSALAANGTPPFSPTTVLVLGSDQRPEGTKEPGASTIGPSRSDSILLMRIGGGHAGRLSIPRDTVVDIPGHGRNKINAAYALGGPELAIRTVEQYLGTEVDHLVEVSFENFPELIDAMGGIDYKGGCVISFINGGARNGGVTLRLKAGENHLTGEQALALARTRKNECNANENDLTRARRQQKIFAAMKDRVTSWHTFVRLPLVAWETPKALQSDMGGPSLLGLVAGLAFSGSPETRVLRPDGVVTLPDGGQGLTISDAERRREVEAFLDA
jgi:LCP family protein required for cell wall assembly